MSDLARKRRKLPNNDTDQLVSFAIGYWRRWLKCPGPKDRLQTREFRRVANLVSQLQGNEVDFDDVQTGREWLGAYLLYPWLIHYQQGLSVLSELPDPPLRVLDVCSGPGAFALAAFRHGAAHVHCLDRSRNALRVCGELCGYNGFAPTTAIWRGPRHPLPSDPYDCIVVGHALGELFPAQVPEAIAEMTRFCRQLGDMLDQGGHLLLVESSQPEVNRWFLTLRDHLIDAGFSIRAPCIWQGHCPARAASAPCFAQREMVKPPFLGQLQRASGINASSLKFSYLALQRGSPPKLRRKSSAERFYRVISPPFEGSLGPRYHLCGEDGKRDLGCRIGDSSDPRSAAFRALRRYDSIRIADPLERGRHLDIASSTSFSQASAPDRPLPEER